MTQPDTSADVRQRVIAVLNEALSAEYHSFVGHMLGSNPYLPPGTEKDLDTLLRIRDEENENAKALLIQLARYRAGPTLKAFRWWKHDLNFLGLDFLLVRAAEVAKQELGRLEQMSKDVPAEDPELAATFRSVIVTKRRHADEIAKLAAVRGKERDARRKAAVAVTGIPLKKAPAAAPAAKPAGAAPATGAPPLPGAPKAPPLPGAPRPPSPPLPGAPKPPSPPLPGAPKAPSPPLPGAGPKAPSPPLPPGAANAPAKPTAPPLPPGFKLPPKPPT